MKVRDLDKLDSRLDRLIYQLSHTFFRNAGKIALGYKVSGQENVPNEGGFIAVGNHRHYLDPFLFPVAFDRHISMVAKIETRDTPIFSHLFKHSGAVFVDRDNFTRENQRDLEIKVNSGDGVGYFFEGTRGDTSRHRRSPYTPNLGEIKEGFALIASRTGSPTIPTAISGLDYFMRTLDPDKFWKARVNIGEPIEAPQKNAKSRQIYIAEASKRVIDLYNQSMEERGVAIASLQDMPELLP